MLRQFALSDAPLVQTLAGDREIAAGTLSIPHPYPPGAAETWIGGLPDAWARGDQAAFAITAPSEGLLGAIGLRIEPAHRRAELGYWIGRPFWGRGYATEAGVAVIGFGFEELGLNRIQAHHFVRNPASGRVMQKLGMTYEGRLREGIIKWGEPEDLDLYSILQREYQDRGIPARAGLIRERTTT